MIVCDRKNHDCMIHICEHCPGLEPLVEYLLQEFDKLDIDEERNHYDNDENEEEKEV